MSHLEELLAVDYEAIEEVADLLMPYENLWKQQLEEGRY